jgi:hypothetical protein
MRAVAARVIQQLARHSSLVTTQRYMHLSPGATEAAIALLEARRRGGLEPVTTSTRRLERRWTRPAIAKHGLKINDLASEPLRGTSPSESRERLGGREADVHG